MGLNQQIQIHAEAHSSIRVQVVENEPVNQSVSWILKPRGVIKALKLASPFHGATEIAAPLSTKGNKGDEHEDHQRLRWTFIAL